MKRAIAFYVLTAIGSAVLAGCSKPEGAVRYPVRGSVTFNGKPVPVGRISFSPDGQKGNSGPGAVADIKDGAYETEEGAVSGAQVVRIEGYSGQPLQGAEAQGVPPEFVSMGKPLFQPYTTKTTLPAEASTQDFEVPAQ